MTRSKAKLKAKRERLKAQIRARRRNPKKKKKKNRRWIWLLVILVILLLLLRNCSCGEPPDPTGPVDAGGGTAAEEVEPEPPIPPLPRMARRDRPEFVAPPPAPLPWIASFRMQVAARSPRLAECFVGAERPGTLKWSTAVEPTEGRVSEHTLEPMLLTDGLDKEERSCVLRVLSDPPYRLSPDGRTTPSRVSLVIEF